MSWGRVPRALARRSLGLLVIVWAVVSICFVLVELTPGDGSGLVLEEGLAAAARPDPPPIGARYIETLVRVSTLDFGSSIRLGRPAIDLIWDRLPHTLLLSGVTLLTLVTVGTGLGIGLALRRHSPWGPAVNGLGQFVDGLPSFWIAVLLQVFVASRLGLPISGLHGPMFEYLGGWAQVKDVVVHLVLPGVGMGIVQAPGLARYVRASMLDQLDQEYVRAARARGLPERSIVWRHVIPVASAPVIGWLGLAVPSLFAGSVFVEYTFGWPGMGSLLLQAATTDDLPVLTACFFFFSILVVLGNGVAAALVGWVDPRAAEGP